MEINRYEDAVGLIPVADIVEGRFVLLTSHSFSADFGSMTDVPGCKVPATADEAKKARFCLTFAQDNRATPFWEPVPATSWAMRGGWSEDAQTPITGSTIFLTHKGNMEGLTVPSGTLAVGYTDGVFTLPSGSYVYDSNVIVPGATLVVADTATDGAGSAGKIKYSSTVAAGAIGVTEAYDSTTGKLTVRIE